MLIAMAVAAGFCILNGCYPWILYSLLPWEVNYQPYTWSHVISQSQLLFFSALAFAFLMTSGLYPSERKLINLDVDWFYRRLGLKLFQVICRLIVTASKESGNVLRSSLEEIIDSVRSIAQPGGTLAGTWSTGSGAIWALILFVLYLIVFYR